jgi:hypothetical protein
MPIPDYNKHNISLPDIRQADYNTWRHRAGGASCGNTMLAGDLSL